MIYSTIRPKHCVIKEVKNMTQAIKNVAIAVKAEGVEPSHVLVSEVNVVYAYGTKKELKQMQVALGVIIDQISV